MQGEGQEGREQGVEEVGKERRGGERRWLSLDKGVLSVTDVDLNIVQSEQHKFVQNE